MADRRQLSKSMEMQYVVRCPGCQQKYLFAGVQLQSEEELACTVCNSVFRLNFDGAKLGVDLVHGPTGSPLGPAEGKVRH